jgi:hypothetical protein
MIAVGKNEVEVTHDDVEASGDETGRIVPSSYLISTGTMSGVNFKCIALPCTG